MATIHDEVGALAKLEHLIDYVFKNIFSILIRCVTREFLQVGADLQHKVEKFLVMLQAFIWIAAFGQRINICEKPDRRALGDRTNFDYLVLVIENPREETPDSTKLLQCVRKISVGDLEVTGLSRAVDLARDLIS